MDIGNQPAQAQLQIVRGDDFVIAWAELDDSGVTPIDLTGWGGEFVITQGAVEKARLDTAGGRLALGADGSIAGQLSEAETAALPAGCSWRLRLTSPSGVTTTKAHGRVALV